MSTPRGIRNNNPLNIRINGTKWEGLCPVKTDNSFFQLRAIAYGLIDYISNGLNIESIKASNALELTFFQNVGINQCFGDI